MNLILTGEFQIINFNKFQWQLKNMIVGKEQKQKNLQFRNKAFEINRTYAIE